MLMVEENKELLAILKDIFEELKWISKRDLTDLDNEAIGAVTLGVGESKMIYERKNMTGEIMFAGISSASTDVTVRVIVDAYTPVELLTIASLLTAGATEPNNMLWAKSPGGGVYALYSNFPLAFEWRIQLEVVNKSATSSVTILGANVSARIRR